MNPRTKTVLQQLEDAEWFSAVGVKDTDAAIVLPSWDEAIKSCSSDDWQDLLLEASNRYCEQLLKHSKERFMHWNDIVKAVKPITMDLVERKIKNVVVANKLPITFEQTVNWDILHLFMESEYADVYAPGFFASQAYWYVHGHFPCGWNGLFPEGKLVIY